jgi:hypothetical protein
MKNQSRIVALCFLGMLIAPFAWAQDKVAEGADKKTGSAVILTVEGKSGAADFTQAQLQALPQKTVITTTPWTEGSHTYTGVLLRDLLDKQGLQNVTKLNGKALNDYVTSINVADAYKYDVLLALSQDGKLLTRRNKGPIWVIYPLSQYPELDKPSYHSAMIWQLRTISVGH